MRKGKIKMFEEFTASTGDDVIKCIKLVNNDGVVVEKPGTSYEEVGIKDEDGSDDYMGGIAEDGTILGVQSGYIREDLPLAKEYPHLAAGCAMNNRDELFDMVLGDKYKGQAQFKKIGKFVQ